MVFNQIQTLSPPRLLSVVLLFLCLVVVVSLCALLHRIICSSAAD